MLKQEVEKNLDKEPLDKGTCCFVFATGSKKKLGKGICFCCYKKQETIWIKDLNIVVFAATRSRNKYGHKIVVAVVIFLS